MPGDQGMTNSSTLFNSAEKKDARNNNSVDNINIDALEAMLPFTFVNFLAENPQALELALYNENLFEKFDYVVVGGLARFNAEVCNILFKSGKFNDRPEYFDVIKAYKTLFEFRKTLPSDMRKR
jgi:hypothetical protein